MPPTPTKTPRGTTAMTAARRKEQEAARGENYRTAEIAEFNAIGEPPMHDPGSGFPWLARIALRAVKRAATDPGLSPEASREQLVRLIPQAAKAMEPARMSARIDALERALEATMSADAKRDESPHGEVTRATAGRVGAEANQ